MIAKLVVLWFVVASAVSEECTTPNGEKARCVSIRSCPVLLSGIISFDPSRAEFAKKSQCGFTTEPQVCCGSVDHYQNVSIATTTTTTTTTDKSYLIPDRTYCGYQHYDDYFHTDNVTSSSSIDEFPWLVSLRYENRKGIDIGYKCAGSLINIRYVLTTGHCLTNSAFHLTSVRLGEYNVKKDEDCIRNGDFDECTDPVIDLGYDELIIHPDFNLARKQNDIALIRLNRTVSYSEYIRPICLPLPGVTFAKPGDDLVLSGWGNKNYAMEASDVKKKVFTKLVKREECREKLKKYNFDITEELMCTLESPDAEVVSCQGDSGAPLMFSNRNQWHIEGITAYGHNCGSDFPSININAISYLSWIIENIRE